MRRRRDSLRPQHALITGGSAGIGSAIAERLTARGCGVTLAARGAEQLERTRARLAARGPAVRTLALDVADETAVADAIERELTDQPIDLLVNSAGVAHAGRFLDTAPERFRTLMEVNYFGTLWVTRAAVPHLRGRPGARVVIVASIAALEGAYGYAAYAPSKFAVYGLGEVLRAELRHQGIGVSVLLPPNTDTAQLAAEVKQLPPEMRPVHEVSSVMNAEQVADALLRGLERGRFEIIPGLEGQALDRLHRIAHTPLRVYLDRKVARALRAGPPTS